jgi:hypothetical protein
MAGLIDAGQVDGPKVASPNQVSPAVHNWVMEPRWERLQWVESGGPPECLHWVESGHSVFAETDLMRIVSIRSR